MTTAGVWGAIPHAEGVAQIAQQQVQGVDKPFKDQSGSSSGTETSSDLEKIGSTQDVPKLVRQLTQQSTGYDDKLRKVNTAHSAKNPTGDYRNSFIDTSEPALDPASDQFDPRVWVKTLIGLQSRDPERYPQRVAGIGYKNLNVHGFGSLTDYQK